MATGLGKLRLSPSQLWAMTPREFAAALAGLTGASTKGAPIARARMDALARAFPDKEQINE